jgi:hypothetical protein
MPWDIQRRADRFCVIKESDGSSAGCHETRAEAEEQLQALYANEGDAALVEVEQASEAAAEAGVEVSTHVAWSGPITYEGIETGDGRLFTDGAVVWNEDLLPFPFKWQRVSAGGHDASVTIGRVDGISRGDNGSILGHGIILTGENAPPEAAEYLGLLAEGAAGGVSIDGDDAEFIVDYVEGANGEITNIKMKFSRINIRALTAVDIPAFASAKIALSSPVVADGGDYVREAKPRDWLPDDSALIASIPVDPPSIWLATPKFTELTPITITDDGRVFGHLCGKETCHIGYGSCKTSPRNCDYDSYFHLGAIKTAEGETVCVGHMTFGGGHADIHLGAQAAAAQYDSTSRVSADVRAGEDEFGTWIVGALRPTLSDTDIREIRSAPLSGDWRPIKGKLQLIAAHAVNVPGFPIPRAKVLVASGGQTEALIITEDCGCDVDEFQRMMFTLDIESMEE